MNDYIDYFENWKEEFIQTGKRNPLPSERIAFKKGFESGKIFKEHNQRENLNEAFQKTLLWLSMNHEDVYNEWKLHIHPREQDNTSVK